MPRQRIGIDILCRTEKRARDSLNALAGVATVALGGLLSPLMQPIPLSASPLAQPLGVALCRGARRACGICVRSRLATTSVVVGVAHRPILLGSTFRPGRQERAQQ